MIYRILFLLSFIMIGKVGMSQSSHELLMEGDDLYKKEQFDLAEEKYRKAKVKDKSGKAAYNLGRSLSEQERFEEAANQFSNAAQMSSDTEVKSKALYNLGNAQFRNQKFQESVDAYEQSLKINEDQLTKENLMLAKYMLEKQEQQKQQQQQQQEQQEQEEQDQEQQQEQQEQQDSNDQQQSQDEQEKSENAEQAEKKDLDKEDARKLLEIIDNEEKKVQEKLRKMKGNSKKPKKDW